MLQTTYKTPVGRRYAGFLEINDNINYIRNLVEYYSTNYTLRKVFKPDLYRVFEPHEIIPMQCLFISIIILYGKCFTNSDRRGVKLDDSFLRNANSDEKSTHKKLMEARHKFLAHAGVTELESFELKVKYENGFIVEKSEGNYRAFAGEIVESESMLPLLEAIQVETNNTLEKIKIELDAELKLLEKRPEIFYDRVMNKQPIVKEDLR